MTRIIIRAMRERQHFIDYLRPKLPDAEWCFDTQRHATMTFLEALQMQGDDGAVHMEEDVILTVGFREKLEREIEVRPRTLIQFFSMRGKDLTKGSRWDRNFMMAQCFYIPPNRARSLLEFAPGWLQAHPKDQTGLDMMVGDWLRALRWDYWLHVPSLVQHRVSQSMINPRRPKNRQSKTFKEPWE